MTNPVKNIFEKLLLWRKSRLVKTARTIPDWMIIFWRSLLGLSFIALGLLIVQSGLRWQLPRIIRNLIIIIDYLVIITFIINGYLKYYFSFPGSVYFKTYWFDLVILAVIIISLFSIKTLTGIIVIRHIPISALSASS